MRHANIATTIDVYTGALEGDKREVAGLVAKSKVTRWVCAVKKLIEPKLLFVDCP